MDSKILLFVNILLILISGIKTELYSSEKKFTRSLTFQASENDSKNSARTQATVQLRTTLLREIGEFLISDINFDRSSIIKDGEEIYTENYSNRIEALTAGIVELKILNEDWSKWSNLLLTIEAEMIVDTDDVLKKINELVQDRQKIKELEESRLRTKAAEEESNKLKNEMSELRRQMAEQTKLHEQALAQHQTKAANDAEILKKEKKK